MAISAERLTRRLAARGHVVHVLHLGANVESASVQSQRESDVMVHRLGALESQHVTLQWADNVIAHLHERVGFQIFHGHSLAPSGREDIHYTPNAVGLDVFQPQAKDAELLQARSSQGEFLIGFVGKLRFKKGTHFILDAFRVVRAQRAAQLLRALRKAFSPNRRHSALSPASRSKHSASREGLWTL